MVDLLTEGETDKQVSRFIADTAVLDPKLVVPARVVWDAYVAWCEDGFEEFVPANHFFASLCRAGVELHPGGRGRLKRVAHGIGFRQEGRHAQRAKAS